MLIKISIKKSLRKNIKNEIIVLILPLYYGIFIVFASPFEFNRLLIPMAPYIFISFSILVFIISDVLYQPTKKFLDKLGKLT